jgi:hypothetical protein
MISPSIGFSLAVSGMMMPPAVFFLSGQAPDDDPVMQGTETHFKTLLSSFSVKD